MKRLVTNCRPLLLIALVLWVQVVYGYHDAASLDSDHQHSSECIVCLSEKLTAAEAGSAVLAVAWLQSAAPQLAAIASAQARIDRNQPIRAPPLLR